MPPITLPVAIGTGSTDPSLLRVKEGQLQESEGVVYQPGDPAVYKIGGRTRFNGSNIASAAVQGLDFVDFDAGTDLVLALVNGVLYSATLAGAAFGSIRTGLSAAVTYFDKVKIFDLLICCDGSDVNWIVKNDNTTIRLSALELTLPPAVAVQGVGLTGTFAYWVTEYDPVNDVESAFSGTAESILLANQGARVTQPAFVNANPPFTQWRIYRGKASGLFPIGWRVTTLAKTSATYDDTTADADLVLNTIYPLVAINDIPESSNRVPPVFKSVAAYQGSLLGVADRSLYFSLTGEPHYFPASYALTFRPTLGGLAQCVRTVGDTAIVLFDNDMFRVNYLPRAGNIDSFFGTDEAQEHLAAFGTPSPQGAVAFSGWGSREVLFLASYAGPMITDGETTSRAVESIAWTTLIPPSLLPTCKVIHNPAAYRVELYYNSSTLDTTEWSCLHFYYDELRLTRSGFYPKLAWTGPHRVPGPGALISSTSGTSVYTGGKTANGRVYVEDDGVSDAAEMIDSDGTINFRLRIGKVYPAGIGMEGRLSRIYIHRKSPASTGIYYVTVTGANEEDTAESSESQEISAAGTGAASTAYNTGARSFDVRVVRDDALAMPPINNITLVFEDLSVDEPVKR